MKKIDLSLVPINALETLKSEIEKELTKRKKPERRDSGKKIFDFLKSNDPTDPLESILKLNSDSLLRLPSLDKHEPSGLILYLPSLLAQDWHDAYPRDIDYGKYYVYAHIDPRSKPFIASKELGGNYGGRPFYIGKGIDNRAFDLKRNQGHGKIIREILNDGYDSSDIVKIIFSELSESKALEIEAKLIYYFGIRYSKKRKGWLINLTEPTVPKFIGDMKIISSLTTRMVFRAKKLAIKANS